MGNATVIPPVSAGPSAGYMAFDTGPGNVLIDAAVRILTRGAAEYDRDARMAFAGERGIDHDYIRRWMARLEYLHRAPPKTTGRELFSDTMARDIVIDLERLGLSSDAIVATITHLTAETIALNLESFIVPTFGHMDELFICGGGSANPYLMSFFQSRFAGTRVAKLNDATTPDSEFADGPLGDGDQPLDGQRHAEDVRNGRPPGIQADAKEAVMFALLGFLCVAGRSVPVASVEKSKKETVMGKLTPGTNFLDLMRKCAVDTDNGTLGRIIVR